MTTRQEEGNQNRVEPTIVDSRIRGANFLFTTVSMKKKTEMDKDGDDTVREALVTCFGMDIAAVIFQHYSRAHVRLKCRLCDEPVLVDRWRVALSPNVPFTFLESSIGLSIRTCRKVAFLPCVDPPSGGIVQEIHDTTTHISRFANHLRRGARYFDNVPYVMHQLKGYTFVGSLCLCNACSILPSSVFSTWTRRDERRIRPLVLLG